MDLVESFLKTDVDEGALGMPRISHQKSYSLLLTRTMGIEDGMEILYVDRPGLREIRGRVEDHFRQRHLPKVLEIAKERGKVKVKVKVIVMPKKLDLLEE